MCHQVFVPESDKGCGVSLINGFMENSGRKIGTFECQRILRSPSQREATFEIGGKTNAKIKIMKKPGNGNVLCLYGRMNDQHPQAGQPCYWTDWRALLKARETSTGRAPLWVNLTSESTELEFREMSPMYMGPVRCYREKGRMVTAVSVETAWQYSKVYSHVKIDGELIDLRGRFISRDTKGDSIPSAEWFRWRDEAYHNPCFSHGHPRFEVNKKHIRRAFPRGSVVAFWYWGGKILNSIQARQQIYAKLYKQFVVKTVGFRKLRAALHRGEDVFIFDRDGYDWLRLGMSPAECIRASHSFGHGMVTAFLLHGIEPTSIIKN